MIIFFLLIIFLFDLDPRGGGGPRVSLETCVIPAKDLPPVLSELLKVGMNIRLLIENLNQLFLHFFCSHYFGCILASFHIIQL